MCCLLKQINTITMKNIFITLMVLGGFSSYAQPYEFQGSLVDHRNAMIIGELKTEFRIMNHANYKFTNKNILLNSDQLTLKVKGYDDEGLWVYVSAPINEGVIGKKRIDITDELGKIIGFTMINIGGREPKFTQLIGGTVIVTIGDQKPKSATLHGFNFYSLKTIEIGGTNFNLESYKVINDNELVLILKSGISIETTDQLTMKISYQTDQNEPQTNNNLSFPIYTRNSETNAMSLICKYKYLDDFTDNTILPLEINLYNNKIDVLFDRTSIFSKDIVIYGDRNITFLSPESTSLTINLSVDPVTAGTKQFILTNRNDPHNNPIYQGTITIKGSPNIKSISNLNNDIISFSPDEESKDITIDGDNIDEILLVPADPTYENIFKILYKKKLSGQNRWVFRIKYNITNVDFTDLPEFDYTFQRDASHKYKDIKFKAEIPSKPYAISNFVSLNNVPFENKAKQTILSTDDFMQAKLLIKRNLIPKLYGNQKLEGEVLIMDENNQLLHTYNISEPNSNLQGIIIENTFLKKSGNPDTIEIPLSLINNFRSTDLPPFAKIKITIRHSSDFYPVEYSQDKKSNTMNLSINSGVWSNFRVALTVPPYMYAFGNRNKYNWYSQPLPLNIGTGIIKQFRNKQNELINFDCGLFITGLNFAPTSNTNSKTDTTYKFIDASALGLLAVGEFYILQKGVNNRIPVQAGVGWIPAFNGQVSKFFFIIGISYNLVLPRSQ